MNTWQPGSAADLRRNDKAGSPLVKNRTPSSVPELKDCGKNEIPDLRVMHIGRLNRSTNEIIYVAYL